MTNILMILKDLVIIPIQMLIAFILLISILMIPVFVSWLVIRPYGEEPVIDLWICIVVFGAILKYPYDDSE